MGQIASRVSAGFHRLGFVLSLPILALAAYIVHQENMQPSGFYVTRVPQAAEAWKPSITSDAQKQFAQTLMEEQQMAGIAAPEGSIIVGVPKGVTRKGDTDWTRYELPDGREIGIASINSKAVTNAAGNFVWAEKGRGSPYTIKDNIEFDGIPVAFLSPYDDFPGVRGSWPKHRQRDWTLAAMVAAAGIGAYLLLGSIGWVIDAFNASALVRPKH
jgi:hypothetical protein